MDFEELRTFIVLAECKSFTKTAEIQHIVQSTVSNRIHSLEEYTGAQLVIRDKAGIVLTTEGSVFLEYAKRIKELDNSALHEIHMLKNYNDRLNVGCAQWIFDYCAGDYIKIFSKTYDKIAINITIAHSEEIILLLQDQIYDVAVMGYKVKAANLVNCPFWFQILYSLVQLNTTDIYIRELKKEDWWIYLLFIPIFGKIIYLRYPKIYYPIKKFSRYTAICWMWQRNFV